MNCPACGTSLSADNDRCSTCDAAVAPAIEGALAPDLAKLDTRRGRAERAHEPPSFRKREPAWKDEVRERLKHRRRHAPGGGPALPLFPEPAKRSEREAKAAEPVPREAPPPAEIRREPAPPVPAPVPQVPAPAVLRESMPAFREPEPSSAAAFGTAAEISDELLELDADIHFGNRAPEASPADSTADVGDLPLQFEAEAPASPAAEAAGPRVLDLVDGFDALGSSWSAAEVEEPVLGDPLPVERPAQLIERIQAGALDAMAVGAVAAVVVYFAARAARVSLPALLPSWPYLGGFLAFFGLTYASFFTGLTGQTLGKMLFRLRVVDRSGAPPGHGRAALRALLGTIGSLALFGLAPVFVDPARRALHDRLLRTRVVRI